MSDTANRVITCIAESTGIDANEIKPESTLTDDLHMDSLDVIEVVMELEFEFDIALPDDEAEQCKTVADVIALVERVVGEVAA